MAKYETPANNTKKAQPGRVGRPPKTGDKAHKKYICFMCDNERYDYDFYNSYTPLMKSNLIPYCKECLKNQCYDLNGAPILENIKYILMLMDKPFLPGLWKSTTESVNSRVTADVFGVYVKNLQMPQFRERSYKDTYKEGAGAPEAADGNSTEPGAADILTDEVRGKWGIGYTDDRYRLFEKKYLELNGSYVEKTAMHTEMLLKYIKYSVMEEIAIINEYADEAKKWGDLAKTLAQNAKINPSQLSKADLSDGLDTIGQISRAVEQASDIIPILPKFRERPQDKADFTLLCYINYIRDLKGLPPCKYPEIYEFYEKFAKEHKAFGERYADEYGDTE